MALEGLFGPSPGPAWERGERVGLRRDGLARDHDDGLRRDRLARDDDDRLRGGDRLLVGRC